MVECTHCAVEQVRMTGHLTQLHDHVHQARLAFLFAGQTIDGVDIFLKHGAIPLPLHVRQRDIDVNFLLYDDG